MRVGWTAGTGATPVGEAEHSYCYCRMGRKAASNMFSDYGQQASVDDVITVALDLNANELRYYLNDTDMGAAHSDVTFSSPTVTEGAIIFPHIGIKNVKVLVNFGVEQPAAKEADGASDAAATAIASLWPLPKALLERPAGAVKFFGHLNRAVTPLVASRRPPESKSDCTVIMMVGLPAAGKSAWVRHYLRDHPNEHWILLNIDSILNLMKVNGIQRRRVHQGRWDMIMGLAAKALTRTLSLACRRRHNYIIDQTNVAREARKRKLTLFKDFLRKCVVIVPTDEEYELRQNKQARTEATNRLPPEALLELKGMLTLPEAEHEPVEDVVFIEPPQERVGEAIELVRRYNEEGRPYLRVNTRRGRRHEPVLSDSRGHPRI